MSNRQSGNKSKNDKTGGGGKNQPGNPSSANQLGHDFLPGRLNLSDWFQLTKEEDETLFIGDIIDEIINHVLDKCEVAYLQKQLVPYTIMQTKNTLLQLIQWHFLAHDEGEKHLESNKEWCEEEEPEPSKIDSWAQGSVPVIVNPAPRKDTVHSRTHKKNKLKEGEKNSEELTVPPEESQVTSPNRTSRIIKKHKKPTVQMKYDNKEPIEGSRKSTTRDTHRKSTVSKNTTRTTPSNKTSARENPVPGKQTGGKQRRQQGSSDVVYDDAGYIVGLPRVALEQLPQYQYQLQYKVVAHNQQVSKTQKLLTNRLRHNARNSAETSKKRKSFLMRHVTEMYSTMKHPATIDVQLSTSTVDTMATATMQNHHDNELYPHVPSLIETIEVEAGVEVSEGVVTKKGPTDEVSQGSAGVGGRRRRLAHNIRDPNQLRLLGNQGPQVLSDVTTSQYSVLPAIPMKQSETNVEAV